MSLINFIFIYP